MLCDMLCLSCKSNLKGEINKWNKIQEFITFQNDKYGGLLKFKSACEFHYFCEDRNDYLKVLNDDENYKSQSFRWDDKTEGQN